MGLDAYAYVVEDVCDHCGRGKDRLEIMYWRKHQDLQDWMRDLYYKKGGKAESFNCEDVELTLEDLSALEMFLEDIHLDSYSGDKDFSFIQTARSAIASGRRVIYSSWW